MAKEDKMNSKAENEIRFLISKNGGDVEWVRAQWNDIVRWHFAQAGITDTKPEASC
jgi:hypothetical protein